jgi:16S rRNA (guanine527-N7)-methyltransferase
MTRDYTVPVPDGSSVDALLSRYLDELYVWNRRINLTAVPRATAQERHVAETRRLLDAAALPSSSRVVDVGTGGGMPGLVLAILRPDLRVTLVEADRRAAGFLIHAAAICERPGVTVLARRAEDAGRDEVHRDAYDLAVSRATAPAPVLCELALPLVRPGGRLLALVSDPAADARRAALASEACGGGTPRVAAPGVLEVLKLVPTPAAYPRRAGIPSRHPLMG